MPGSPENDSLVSSQTLVDMDTVPKAARGAQANAMSLCSGGVGTQSVVARSTFGTASIVKRWQANRKPQAEERGSE